MIFKNHKKRANRKRVSTFCRRAKLIWSDREISSSQNLPPENPKICLRQFFRCCDSCSVLPPSPFRRLRRLEFFPRIFTDGFAARILPPTGSLFAASGAKKLPLCLLEPSAREFASGLKFASGEVLSISPQFCTPA